jgi:hypothetical protein
LAVVIIISRGVEEEEVVVVAGLVACRVFREAEYPVSTVDGGTCTPWSTATSTRARREEEVAGQPRREVKEEEEEEEEKERGGEERAKEVKLARDTETSLWFGARVESGQRWPGWGALWLAGGRLSGSWAVLPSSLLLTPGRIFILRCYYCCDNDDDDDDDDDDHADIAPCHFCAF